MAQTLTAPPAGAARPSGNRTAEAAPRRAPVLQASRMPQQLSLFGRLAPAPAGRQRTD